jgi:hypothetical protein
VIIFKVFNRFLLVLRWLYSIVTLSKGRRKLVCIPSIILESLFFNAHASLLYFEVTFVIYSHFCFDNIYLPAFLLIMTCILLNDCNFIFRSLLLSRIGIFWCLFSNEFFLQWMNKEANGAHCTKVYCFTFLAIDVGSVTMNLPLHLLCIRKICRRSSLWVCDSRLSLSLTHTHKIWQPQYWG